MVKIKYRLSLFILFFITSLFSFSQSTKKKSGNGNRIGFGPVIGFYSINRNHAVNARQKMSALIGFKREQRIGREYKTYFLFGIDYFFHGLNFRSYYFNPDTLKLYDKSFPYTYSLFIHELNLPIQFKYLFKREDNSLFSPYIAAGYHLRYLLPCNLKILENGTEITNDDPELKFKNAILNDRLNSFVSIAVGWQKNSLTSSRGSFFAELNFRYGLSAYYFETDYSATSLYINSTHLNLQLGFKF